MTLLIERLQSLIGFAKESARLRMTPVYSVAQHAHFDVFEERLNAMPGLRLNIAEGESDEIWLRLERLHETNPPVPQSKLLSEWIELPTSPDKDPILKKEVERKRLIELGAIPPDEETKEPRSSTLSLGDFPEGKTVEIQFKAYYEGEWKIWALEEKERRKSILLYSKLFLLAQKMQGNLVDSPLELVWGVGIAVWKLQKTTVTYPLLTQLVEISLNEQNMSLEIRPRSSDPRLEVDIYAAYDNPGLAQLVATGRDFFQSNGNVLNPFDPESFNRLLRAAATTLDARGVYLPDKIPTQDRTIPKPNETLNVTDTWVLFARPRTNNLFIQDLERFDKGLTDAEQLPPVVGALVTEPSNIREDVALPTFRGLSFTEGRQVNHSRPIQELYFPMPYNDEQVQIVQMLEMYDGVVVQGPPGTGKTHTIANVICHYLAQGKRVLVTSMKDPALAVLQEKLPIDLQPLAISLLTSEAEGMKQFELAIRKIATEVQSINRTDYERDITRTHGQIDEIHAQIALNDNKISGWAAKQLSQIVLDEAILRPAEAAREVVENRAEIEWFPDHISIGEEHRAQFDNTAITALRSARLALGEDLSYLNKKVPQITSLPNNHTLLQVHQDLVRIPELKSKEASGEIPSLIDNSPETYQKAISLIAQVANLRLLLQELEGTHESWISSLQSYLRRSRQNEILDLFLALKREVEEALVQRRQFIARPVSLAADLYKNDEMVEAIRNRTAGRSPFGLMGLIGKGEQKKLLDAILVVNAKPQAATDWEHILRYITYQRSAQGLLHRWNVLSNELPLPHIEESPDHLVTAGQVLELYEKITKALQEEENIARDLKHLLPSWKRSNERLLNNTVLDEAETILTHHQIRYRLTQTWVVKENFAAALSGCDGEITERLRNFLNARLGSQGITDTEVQTEWSILMNALIRIHDLMPHLQTITQVTSDIAASGAVSWAAMLQSVPHGGAYDLLLPDNWQEVWRLRRLTTYLDTIDGGDDLKRLSRVRTELEIDLAAFYRKAISKLAWLKLAENATSEVLAALAAYQNAVQKIGKGTGIRAGRHRKDARFAAEKANSAIPCWIMPHYRVSESLPASLGCFDLVIVDEASQSDLSALPAILRAQKVLIVGDDKQVSPEGVGLEEERLRSLMSRFLSNQVEIYRPQMSPERSIYDLFKVVFAKSTVMLREHFRCVAPIIEYSKREFYNHELKPLRLPRASERMDPPLVDVYVKDGNRNGDVNKPEACFIVDEICKIIDDPTMQKRSIGMVSLLGNSQALLVMQLLSERIGEEKITQFRITCGDARTFQGKERDIMFLSMVASPRNAHAQTQNMIAQRFNVAASRARDRMYLVRSVSLDDLSPADILRSRLIQHFKAPFAQDPTEVKDLRQRCESPFEREVFDVLVERGYRVIPQVPVGSYRIDMVVEGDNDSRLAIECDGDRYHGPDHWESDMNRQRILERAGWRFWRCFASTFVLRRNAVIQDLIETLASYNIYPYGGGEAITTIHVESRVVTTFANNREAEADASIEAD